VKFLITGGAGFLGGHIRAELEANHHTVVVIDRALDRHQDLRFDPLVVARFDEHPDTDVCIHLAAKVGRLFGEDDPMETITDNIGMTALVARECGRRNIRLVYASTSEVYGDNGSIECDEDYGPFTRPHNLYGISKLMGEQVCAHYAPDLLTILRFSMPYGPGLPAGRGRAAIINMLHQALHRQPIPVHRGAERSWCYVGDTARATRMIIEKTGGGAFNVGRDRPRTTMNDIARMACKLTGAGANTIELVDAPQAQTVVKRLSTRKLEELGWEPEVDLARGMQLTLEWVRTLDETGAVAA
jgi:nucleoside-diphosphate-sugar epimerase